MDEPGPIGDEVDFIICLVCMPLIIATVWFLIVASGGGYAV